MPIDRSEFLARLSVQFPEVFAQICEEDWELLHLEVATFRGATEEAIDAGQSWMAEKHFRFVDEVLRDAEPELQNALEVSYLEDLALGECTPKRHQAVKERMPRALREKLVEHHPNWR